VCELNLASTQIDVAAAGIKHSQDSTIFTYTVSLIEYPKNIILIKQYKSLLIACAAFIQCTLAFHAAARSAKNIHQVATPGTAM